MKLKTIAIIPARGGSKRLPHKNIKLLGEKPLILHSIQYAKRHNFIDEVYVSTDCTDIMKVAIENGAQVIERPHELAGDYEPTISAIKHAILSIPSPIENVIILQATNPLRPKELLNDVFKCYTQHALSSLFTVTENTKKFGKIQQNKFIPYNYSPGQRSQDLEKLYYENGLIYITKAKSIMEGYIMTPDALPYIVNHIFANVDIDTIEDFDYAEYLIKNHEEK
ncbi:MAG: acylneuraminate cytidylyltransferase family protein [Bacteroidetes bacterium]|nr:acylneuraminate cytidylyltransferase family protein [Bacteroidota bacterium]